MLYYTNVTEAQEIKTTSQTTQKPENSQGGRSTSEKTSQAVRDQTILEELHTSPEPITLEKIKVKAVERVKTLRSKSPDESAELSAAQAAVLEAVKNPDNFQADFVFRGETTPPQDTDLTRVLHDIAETTKKGRTIVNMKGKLEDWIYELEASTGDKTDTAKQEIRKYKDKLFKKWTELVVEESEQQDKTLSSQRKASKSDKEKAAEFWRTNAIVGENARLDHVEKGIRRGSGSLSGGQERGTPTQRRIYIPLTSVVPDVSVLPEEVQKVIRGQEAVVRTSVEGDLTAIDHEKGINTIAESSLPDDAKDRLLRVAQANRQQAQEQVLERQAGRERDPGFTTFNAQYLTPEERKKIKDGGPDYWEELYNRVIFLLTADPNADVIRDQSLTSKISALQEYITGEGAKWFEERGESPAAAAQHANTIVREMHVETNETIEAHNVFRAILGAPSVEDTTKAMAFVTVAQYDRLSGRSLAENPLKQRIVADANRIYEQSAVALVAKKYRRHQYLGDKKKRTGMLSEAERKELEGGYMLEFKDLIPIGSLWTNIRVKHHKQHVWGSVYGYLENVKQTNPNMSVDDAVQKAAEELVQKSKNDWTEIKNIIVSEDVFEAQAIEKFREAHEGRLPTSFSEEDEKIFKTLQQEMKQRGITPEQESIDQVVAYTADENRLLQDIDAGQYYSPVEQAVFDELLGSERVKIEEEAKLLKNITKEEVAKWKEEQLNKRRNYIRIAITSARQHMYFSAHLQKINATVGMLPESGPGHLQGLAFEYLLRAFNPEVLMHQRFWEYGQPVVREVASLTYLMFFRHFFGDQLRLSNQQEWEDKLKHALEFTGDESFPKAPADVPNARKGFDDIIKYLQDELGTPYSMMFTAQFLPSGGIYDPGGGWKDMLSNQEMAEQLLEATGRLGPINDPNRFEYSLGLQLDIAKDLNNNEVNRAAGGFKTLDILLARMKQERSMSGLEARTGNRIVDSAKEYLSSRLNTFDLAAIDTMKGLIAQHQKALERNDASQIVQTANKIRDLYKDKDFDNVKDELVVQRKKHILKKIAQRLPTFTPQFHPEDAQKIVRSSMERNNAITAEIERRKLRDQAREIFIYDKSEEVWEKLQHALYAVQNDLVRHEVVNRDVDKYFGREEVGFPTLDTYLRQFLGDDYNRYGDTCHEITKNLRNFFDDMEQGKRGRAQRLSNEGKISEADRKFVGMAQLEKVARFARPATFLGDRQWESTQFGLAGGPAVIKRRTGEIGEMAGVAGRLDQLIPNIHHMEPQKIMEELKAITTTIAGVESPDVAVMRGRSVMEAWIEMTKAPQWLENIPEAEGLLRMFVGHDSKFVREIARKKGSRIVQITRDPHDPIFQKNELRQFVDLAWSIDAFLQKPEVFDEFYERFKVENKDLQGYQFRRILPYIAFAIAALMLIQGWTILQQGEEED
ncbi:MAG: hypothetical protein NUV98_06285 [Candidatus Roizmanbacteria bacterium]|nr:hypothetical protein [Candidatus Roizmanbacteria bacterium]